MSIKTKFIVYLSPLWFALVLLFFLSVLNPVTSGPGGVLLVFIATYLLFASSLFVLLHLGLAVIHKLLRRYRRGAGMQGKNISAKKAYYVASVLAFGPVLLLALHSVRQLQVVDIVLIALFLFLAIFYVTKRQS